MLHPLAGGAGGRRGEPKAGHQEGREEPKPWPGTLGSGVQWHSPRTANSEPPEIRRDINQ